MTIQCITTDHAPAAIGPYSQAVVAGGMLYVSGQIPLDCKTGAMVDGGISSQTKQVLENLKAIVEASECDMSHVVKVTIYLTDLQQFSVVNEIYGTFFSAPYPARACVEVSNLPKGVEVEMDAIVQLTLKH
ncbi:RidA family protein [uncultured Rubinisphaera sp.]|uniref:RidA family protein n=1 Tax=uncultured Rubinisphaera sp. TaxID=1678686 RepID=UPI0030DB208C|tara:strand:- start:2578 stop:2970 length:393 start_codon:yes stop_codon:yes gene_type:complete